MCAASGWSRRGGGGGRYMSAPCMRAAVEPKGEGRLKERASGS